MSKDIRFTQFKIRTTDSATKHALIVHFNNLKCITINILNELSMIVYIESEFKDLYLDVLSLNFGIIEIETINL